MNRAVLSWIIVVMITTVVLYVLRAKRRK